MTEQQITSEYLFQTIGELMVENKLIRQQAIELQKITDEQLKTINLAVNRESWLKSAFNYFLSFILAAAASIAGAILLEKYKKRKMMDKESV